VSNGDGGGGGNGVYDLSTNEFTDIIHPQGYRLLQGFELAGQGGGPVWRYQVGDAIIEKSVVLVQGQDTVIVRYTLLPQATAGKKKTIRLQIQPMLAGRDFHSTIQLHQRPWWTLAMQTDNSIVL